MRHGTRRIVIGKRKVYHMKLCVLANLYWDLTLDETLAKLKPLGVQAVEIGAGGFPGKAQCNPAQLLADEKKLQEWKDTFKKYDIGGSCLPWQSDSSR